MLIARDTKIYSRDHGSPHQYQDTEIIELVTQKCNCGTVIFKKMEARVVQSLRVANPGEGDSHCRTDETCRHTVAVDTQHDEVGTLSEDIGDGRTPT